MNEHEKKAREIVQSVRGGRSLFYAIAAALDEAVEAEKQRCADVADAYGIVVCTADQVGPKVVTGRTIAKAIRARGEAND